jgi:hypothetical protein
MPLVTVGNHSYTHANNHYRYFSSSVEDLLADLARADNSLGLKAPPIYARLPRRNVFRLPDMLSDDLSIGKPEDRREEPGFEFVAAPATISMAGITNGFTTIGANLFRRLSIWPTTTSMISSNSELEAGPPMR